MPLFSSIPDDHNMAELGREGLEGWCITNRLIKAAKKQKKTKQICMMKHMATFFFCKLQLSFHASFTEDSIVNIVHPSAAE